MKAAASRKSVSSKKIRSQPSNATDRAPIEKSLSGLRQVASVCQACDLWKTATQTVFGEGLRSAKIVLVGEQPGDQEDRSGHPFVGPAGKLLDEALDLAGINRKDLYLTNVVKHFKWSPAMRGKRRIHKKPVSAEIQACRPWLDAELRVIKPEILVCLGATAAQALFGSGFSVTRERGRKIASPLAPNVFATVHPSSILRAPDSDSRQLQMKQFVADLKQIATLMNKISTPDSSSTA